MNSIKLIGTYDKEAGTVKCKRLSDNYDTIPVAFTDGFDYGDGERGYFLGTIINDKGQIFVGVHELGTSFELNEYVADSTECELIGVIKKVYPVRVTKKNRKLQDLLVEAQGQLIKIVAFEACPEFIKAGITVHINGRLQSRTFTQVGTFGIMNKIVYEVALKRLDVIDGEGQHN